MNSTFTKLKKLRGRSFDELRVRASQMLHARAEQHGLSRQARLPSDTELLASLDSSRFARAPQASEDLLDHFRTRSAPRFFAGLDDPHQTLAFLNRSGELLMRGATIERADRIRAGRFDLLGLRDLDFGAPPDWHLEPVANLRAPFQHWSRIAYLDPRVAGDKKITWELNRHGYFVTLGRAYLYTEDEIHAETFAAHLASWMDANPPKQGINWASSLEVSFRAIAWLWALYFFRESSHLTPVLFARAMKFFYVHARHLETYLSTYFSPNTHLTGEALGLYYIGTLLPEFRRAARWREKGRQIFLDKLARHVQTDGVYFEQASYYHRYTADFCLHFHLLAELNDDATPPDFEERLILLLDHLMYITKPDGETPLYGDDDGGRLLALDEAAATDFRSTLRTGAALFGRADYKYVAQLGIEESSNAAIEEAAWLLGADRAESFDTLEDHPSETTSRAFSASGYYVMRDSWSSQANYMLIDGGAHGAKNGAHAHADALSFELAAHGRTLLVDPGTYTYTKSLELRDAFRRTAAHNTLTLDSESSSVPATAFAWQRVAEVSTRKWISEKRFDLFQGTHDGYMRLPQSPALHTRSMLFLKNDYWLMRDRVETTGEHRYDFHFHFAPGCAPTIEDIVDEREEGSGVVAVRERKEDAPGLDIHTCGVAGTWHCEPGWVSKAYAARSEAPVCVFSAKAAGAQELITFLVPRAADAIGTYLRQIEAIGGVACELTGACSPNGEGEDVLLATVDGGVIETARFVSDGELTWMRLHGRGGMPQEFVLIGGSRLIVDGVALLQGEVREGFFAAKHTGDGRLEIETNRADEWCVAVCGASVISVNGEEFEVKGIEYAMFMGGRLAGEESGREPERHLLQEAKG